MQVILITPPDTAAAEVATVNRLFSAGLQTLHLRKPTCSRKQVKKYLQQVDPRWHSRIVLHQHHDLASEFAIKGIHFKEKDRPQAPIPQTLPGLTQSTSFHMIGDLKKDWGSLNYAFLSPVFDSISKEGYSAAGFSPEELSAVLREGLLPVYALGGVTPDCMSLVHEWGFSGVGILGAVWSAPDPVAAFQAFQHHPLT